MARFHLNLVEDQHLPDEDGVELPDLATARAQAISGGRGVMAEHLVLGRQINLAHRIEIADDHGIVLATLPFRELVNIVER